MDRDAAPPTVASSRWLEAAVPVAILGLRLALRRTPWYFDWMIVLSLFWMLQLIPAGKKARTLVTLGALLLLLGIYLVRVFPILVDTIRFCV
ncbi:MAG TPA: hypothetical protein VKW04_23670 [Planctomycetota bacterium]|jgi:hypothetical protein|nr:hypothetical protein [Planctomycetota bacterium]